MFSAHCSAYILFCVNYKNVVNIIRPTSALKPTLTGTLPVEVPTNENIIQGGSERWKGALNNLR